MAFPETHHRIIWGDARRMDAVADQSVHLVVTSPPYWQLKDYGSSEGQIGFHDSYEAYINHLNLVWSECHRVLHDGCRLCVNIGDQFARSAYYGRYKVVPIRTEITRFCETIGLDYMGAIIWQKATTCNTSGGGVIMGSFPYPRNGIVKLDYEFILIFKKPGNSPKPLSPEAKEASRLDPEEWNRLFFGHWNFPGARQTRHLAMFPEELPARLIKMFTFVGETVLDPFAGSGTTSLAARNLGRHSVGVELNEAFLPLIREKVEGTEGDLFRSSGLTIEKVEVPSVEELQERLDDLPYLFHDPIPVSLKMDPRSETFESRVDASGGVDRETYFKVSEILAGDKVRLDSGETIRLLGVRIKPGKEEEARAFLSEKTRGQKVFLKFDKIERDSDGNRYGYLHLKNKTHLNAHLIRYGLAEPDTELEYRYKKRFLSRHAAL